MDKLEAEAISELKHQIKVLTISSEKELKESKLPLANAQGRRDRAEKVFGLLMRAAFRTSDQNSKFQPCIDDLEFLKEVGPALCKTLRIGTLTNFCKTLHPFESENDKEDELNLNDSIFHLHGNKLKDDITEFEDQTLRANDLAEAIKTILDQKSLEPVEPVEVRLLDGHGRMLVCLIRALMKLDVDLDKLVKLGRLVLKVFEIDDVVHKYHQYVFPMCVSKCKESIIAMRKDPPDSFNNNVVYLNFCSVKSGSVGGAWTSHFKTQTIDNWVPHCCKENVLKYIWKIAHPPYLCTVMVSLVIKDKCEPNDKYYGHFRTTLGNYITGLGFLYLLLDEDLFNAKIVSVRPKDGIVWEDSEQCRKPKRLKSGIWGNPFVTLLVRSIKEGRKKELKKLQVRFDEWEIADLQENTMQKEARVRVTRGEHEGKQGKITKRTPCTVDIDCRDGSNISGVLLNLCEPVSIEDDSENDSDDGSMYGSLVYVWK